MSTKKEIKLTEKQLQIIGGIYAEREALQKEAQKLADAITRRESEFLINLCESNGVEAVQGIEIKDGSVFVPLPDSKPTKSEEIKSKLKKA